MLIGLFFISGCCFSQVTGKAANVRTINFYVVNKPKTFDLFSRTVIWRARRKARRHNNFLRLIVSGSLPEIYQKIAACLMKENAQIGTLWFDTHGHYSNGYSSFLIGRMEFNYRTIRDTSYTKILEKIAEFCGPHSNIVIGSCYGGATFERKDYNGNSLGNMKGDSLMIGLARVFKNSMVYGTESWVMTKPGIFQKQRYALAGYPLQRRFKDEIYRPVWERMGVWHRFSTRSSVFETINTVSLTRLGDLIIKGESYLEHPKYQQKLARNRKKLRPGLAKL